MHIKSKQNMFSYAAPSLSLHCSSYSGSDFNIINTFGYIFKIITGFFSINIKSDYI